MRHRYVVLLTFIKHLTNQLGVAPVTPRWIPVLTWRPQLYRVVPVMCSWSSLKDRRMKTHMIWILPEND